LGLALFIEEVAAVSTPDWHDDEALLADLRQALDAAGPITPAMREGGIAAYAWRSIDVELELAALVFDSAAGTGRLARAQADEGPRSLLFEGAELSVQIELSPAGLMGQLLPPAEGEVILQHSRGHEDRLAADDVGIFSARVAPDQPFRVRATSGGHSVVTDWVTP
jgi:hypothetical protein